MTCRFWSVRGRRSRQALPAFPRSCSTARARVRRKSTCETTACPEGRPVIPPGRRRGGVRRNRCTTTPLLLERLATLTEQLNTILGPENQEQLSGIPSQFQPAHGRAGRRDPRGWSPNLEDFQTTLEEFNQTLDGDREADADHRYAGARRRERRLPPNCAGRFKSANDAAAALAATLEDTRPAAKQLRESTLPNAEATLKDLRRHQPGAGDRSPKSSESEGGGRIGGRQRALPDYKP